MVTKSAHQPNTESRDLVEFLALCGEAKTDICIQLGISMTALEQHYLDELRIGAVKQRHKLLVRMRDKAMDGSLPAIKELLDLHDRSRMVQRPAPGSGDEAPVRLGKKEQADFDAARPDQGSPMGGLLAQRLSAGQKAN